MKERFKQMTLDHLDAIREVLCYLYPPMEGIDDDTVSGLWDDLEEARMRKMAEHEQSDKAKREETDALYASMFHPWKGETA